MKIKTTRVLRWSYNTIKIFIYIILGFILISFIGALFLKRSGHEFMYSALLNVFGGLLTGLILLSYQYLSNKNLQEATNIIEKLELLKGIGVDVPDILDFCSDDNIPTDEELANGGGNIQDILNEDEAVSCALKKYNIEIQRAEDQLIKIKDFLNSVLKLDLDISTYENKLQQVKKYFSKFREENIYFNAPIILYKNTLDDSCELGDSRDIIEIFKNEEEKENYLKENSYISDDKSYFIDESDNGYSVTLVFENDTEVLSENIYNKWIQEMNDLYNSTEKFNKVFLEKKNQILDLHNKSANIIH